MEGIRSQIATALVTLELNVTELYMYLYYFFLIHQLLSVLTSGVLHHKLVTISKASKLISPFNLMLQLV